MPGLEVLDYSSPTHIVLNNVVRLMMILMMMIIITMILIIITNPHCSSLNCGMTLDDHDDFNDRHLWLARMIKIQMNLSAKLLIKFTTHNLFVI